MRGIPRAIDMVIGQARLRRVVIALHGFHNPVGIVGSDQGRGAVEEKREFGAREVAVLAMVGDGRRGLVDVTDHDVGRMIAHQLFHLAHLAYGFLDLGSAKLPEQWQVGLRHHAQPVKHGVDFGLLRTLGEPEKVHVGDFGDQDVVDQLLHVALHHRHFKVAHGVGTTKNDGFAIEIERALCF